MCLRHVGRSDALDHQLHAELVFIQDVCKGKEAARGSGGLQSHNFLCSIGNVCEPTCSCGATLWRHLVAHVEEAAEQELLGVLHVGAVGRLGLQTPDDTHKWTANILETPLGNSASSRQKIGFNNSICKYQRILQTYL